MSFCGGEGHGGVWVVVCGLVWDFFSIFLYFKKKKEKAPILCHHFYGICNSGKNLSLI